MTCFLNPLPSLDTVLRRSLQEERETVYVSAVEAAGGRLAEFSANDPRRLANLFSRGLEFTQTARVVTPTAATERESEQEVPWHAARHVTGPRLGPRPAICFSLRLHPHGFRRCSRRSSPLMRPLRGCLENRGHDASLLVLSGEQETNWWSGVQREVCVMVAWREVVFLLLPFEWSRQCTLWFAPC
ncbi:hypothetical protein VZT92_018035 [Zoarces viviparus]|uniref:Uncharacterized protein n=1 Tax=Zoarces viviparus TaxID=48416 RepID=A0AAW1ENK7_ZOAVI